MPMFPNGLKSLRDLLRSPAFAPATLSGFYMNGSTNPALKAAVARVKGGTGRGRIVQKGDSTTVGQGGGTTADTYGLTNARPFRPGAVLAGLLTSAGIPALDTAVVSDNGMYNASSFTAGILGYDTRLASPAPVWSIAGKSQIYAGGGFLNSNTGVFSCTEIGDSCEIIYYNSANGTLNFTVDGAAPASGPASATVASGTGFTSVTIKAASVGSHVWGMAGSVVNLAACEMRVYDSTKPALDIINHAVLGGTSAGQSATDSAKHWDNLEALAFAAPDLTTINLGLNDMNGGVSVSTYTANLQAIITQAKVSGDVLLIFPTPASGNYNNNVSAFDAAAQSLAASNGIPYFSLYQYYGPWTSAFGTRQFDGIVHPKAALYAEIAGLEQQALNLMLAA